MQSEPRYDGVNTISLSLIFGRAAAVLWDGEGFFALCIYHYLAPPSPNTIAGHVRVCVLTGAYVDWPLLYNSRNENSARPALSDRPLTLYRLIFPSLQIQRAAD